MPLPYASRKLLAGIHDSEAARLFSHCEGCWGNERMGSISRGVKFNDGDLHNGDRRQASLLIGLKEAIQ